MKTLKQTVESGFWKRRVSLGESGSFVKGKSEFPLRKVQEAEKGWKTGISGQRENSEIALHFCFIVTQITQILTDFYEGMIGKRLWFYKN